MMIMKTSSSRHAVALLLVVVVLFAAVAVESRVIAGPQHRFVIDDQPPAENSFDYDANQIIRNTMKRNRQCLLNAGLSQGCDLSDMLQAQTQARKFMSFAGPGK